MQHVPAEPVIRSGNKLQKIYCEKINKKQDGVRREMAAGRSAEMLHSLLYLKDICTQTGAAVDMNFIIHVLFSKHTMF